MTGGRHPNHRPSSTLPVELRRTTVPPAVRAWIQRETGAAVTTVRRLAGSSTAAVHRIGLANGRSLALRRYVWPGFQEDEPLAPQREVDALGFAGAHGLPVPDVVAADVTGDALGDGIPAILMSFVRGRAVPVPDLRRLAEMAAEIHAVDADGFGYAYFPWCVDALAGPPPGARRPDLWRRALELRASAMPAYRPAFAHRDFHPGNVLWARGRCTGVVDWAEACRGPAGCDVAQCRANLLGLGGPASASAFVRAYESATGEPHHPYWDLANLLEHDADHWTPQTVAEAEPELERAMAGL